MNKANPPGIEIFEQTLKAAQTIVNTLSKKYPRLTAEDDAQFQSGITQGFMEAVRMFTATNGHRFEMFNKVLKLYNKRERYDIIIKELKTFANQTSQYNPDSSSGS